MAKIRTPFVFVNPERYGDPSLSSSPQRTRSKLSRAATDFPRFSWLPCKVRQNIIRIAIEEASEYWKDWHEGRDNPVMLQSRRGVLRMQLQYRHPPSLPQLACVSTEWEDEIEKKLFKTLRLRALPDSRSDDGSDLDAFSAIVTGPRRQYLVDLKLESYRKYPTHRRTGSGNAEFHRTGGNYQSVVRLFQILGSWDHEHVRDDLLKLILDIELQDFPLVHLLGEIRKLPNIPVIGALEINMESDEFSKLPLALPFLLRKLPQLELAQLHLSPWCLSNTNDKDLEIQGEHLHSILS